MASPAPSSAPTTGSPVPRMVARRREANSNPLVQRQKRPRAPVVNRQKLAAPPPPPPIAAAPAKTVSSTASSVSGTGSAIAVDDEGEWHEFKLTTTKASLLKGLRHHVMRMQSKREIDPTDPTQFTRPVRLHRRDPRAPLQGAKEEAAANQLAAANKAAEAGEKAKDEVEQAKKDAEKQANLDKIAPFGGAQKQKQKVFHKKTQQVFKSNDAEKKLRYEEFFPWFIEDFDNKNTWQGQLESSLSKGVFAMFVLEEGAFRMVPIEKWYKFQEKNRFPTMTSEEAELEMKKNARPPRWLMKRTEEKESKQRELEENARANKTLFTRKGDRLKGEADNDDLDFEDDQFADDEEAPIMEGEEQENKEIEKRIKKEQLSANFFDARDERDWEKEELERKKLEEVRRKHGKRVKKALMNREGNFTYESDSDANPYGTSGDEDSEDEEETARKEEEKKKEEERKKAEAAAEKEKADPRKSKTPPVATPASTSTPSAVAAPAPSQPKSKATGGTTGAPHPNAANKKDKHPAGTPLPLSDKKPQLKRAGTPPHPESGTESRKKPKKNNAATNSTTGKSTTLPILGGTDKKNIVKLKVASESLSQIASSTPSPSPPPPGVGAGNKKRKADVSAGARSGDERSGEMSDGPGSKKQRIKITTGGRSLSPAAAAAASRQGTPGASRAGSPAAAAGAGNTSAPAARGTPGPPDFITDAEIRTVLSSNPEGVTLKFIADKFKNRVRNEEVKKGLVSSLRRLSVSTDKRTYKLKEGVSA
ncbi:unnamed protein product [Tuber melanosporum]|uniref:(Perigord truffle) hypothetical protein n=1 Tax=Tuber melanosporum (strain Mel28) TaxID=656061 RepID=D5GNE3_TUBMM|nr:uncharacterized protein GSTUM_00011245001 [Tuber melanosporum]CAZ86036.1 unnamed protein product [Tuber melanosporum]